MSRYARIAAGLTLGAALAAAAPSARAQGAGKGFLFKEPDGSFSLRGGFAAPSARSDIFDFSTQQLTLSRGDFAGLTVAADLGVRLTERLDLVLGASYAGASPRSESRGYIGTDNLPIQQTTDFQRLPLTAGVKAYLGERGRSVGRFAWIPAKYVPYVGVGGGAMWYRFRQQGEFVDYQTRDIFQDDLGSSGWAPTAYGAAGIDFSLGPRFALTTEARYTYGKANLSDSFQGFNRIDLSGFAATAGFYVRF